MVPVSSVDRGRYHEENRIRSILKANPKKEKTYRDLSVEKEIVE